MFETPAVSPSRRRRLVIAIAIGYRRPRVRDEEWLTVAPKEYAKTTATIPNQSGVRNMTGQSATTLYARLGGYDAIAAVCNDLLPRLMSDPELGRFWKNRGADSIRREKQLLIDYFCASAGGPLYYTGRDMKVSHAGMGISVKDWQALVGHLNATLDKFQVPAAERREALAFVESTRAAIVEA
jgi:hemoglobin